MEGRDFEVAKACGDMLQEIVKPFGKPKKSVSTESLHETLGRCFPEIVLECLPIRPSDKV